MAYGSSQIPEVKRATGSTNKKRPPEDPMGPVLELLKTFGLQNCRSYYDSLVRGKIVRLDNAGRQPPVKIAGKRPGGGRCKEVQQDKRSWEGLRYEDFHQLRGLWQSYASELLPTELRALTEQLPLLDLHGSTLKVVQAKSPGMVHLEGTVLEETQRTFRIITKESKVKLLPKESCTFEVQVHGRKALLLGPAWSHRLPGGVPGPRTSKEWSLT